MKEDGILVIAGILGYLVAAAIQVGAILGVVYLAAVIVKHVMGI